VSFLVAASVRYAIYSSATYSIKEYAKCSIITPDKLPRVHDLEMKAGEIFNGVLSPSAYLGAL
jgi:hypothetical protein